MKHITTWYPDTCGCVIDIEWDDNVPQEQRVHKAKSSKKCPVHSGNDDIDTHYAKVSEENQRKNKVYGKILEVEGLYVNEIQGKDTIKKLRPDLEYRWEFDTDRNLIIDVTDLKKTERDSLLLLLAEFGSRVRFK